MSVYDVECEECCAKPDQACREWPHGPPVAAHLCRQKRSKTLPANKQWRRCAMGACEWWVDHVGFCEEHVEPVRRVPRV